MDGSRSGGIIAATWAAMVQIGHAGYLNYARQIFETSFAMQDAVRQHPELKMMGHPTFLFSFTSDVFDVYHINDFMRTRGWRFNGQQYPNALHMAVTRPQTQSGVADTFAVTVEAFNIAERYQTPVIILSDQEIAQRKETVDPIDTRRFSIEERLQPTGVERDGYAMQADRLDLAVQRDLAAADREAAGFHRLCQVAGGHQPAVLLEGPRDPLADVAPVERLHGAALGQLLQQVGQVGVAVTAAFLQRLSPGEQ